MAGKGTKLIANNKKAYHDYFIEDKYEAGIVLHGTEVKSSAWASAALRNLLFMQIMEIYIEHMHIAPYEKGNIFNKDPLRTKLLLHKREITKLLGQVSQKGYTIMPLQVYFKDSLVKVQIGLARGKKLYDKREDIAKKDQRREAEREMKIRLR